MEPLFSVVFGKFLAERFYNVAGTIAKSFSKEFTKHNTEKGFHVTGIYPLNENIFNVD